MDSPSPCRVPKGRRDLDRVAWGLDLPSPYPLPEGGEEFEDRREYRLSVVSTPGPRAGMFYRLWNNGDEAWSRHRVNIYDARAGGARTAGWLWPLGQAGLWVSAALCGQIAAPLGPHDIDALRAAVADEATWRAAYECQFVDEAHALLPYDLLLARVDDTLSYHLNLKTMSAPGDLYAGYDVGRKHDLSVLIVLERIGEGFRWRGAVELRESPFDEQFELLSSVLQVGGLQRLAIDQSGLGMQLAEELVRKFGSRVEPITMTAPVKESLASRILAAFQRGDVGIPDHRPLIDDLHSIQRTVTLSGNVRYAAPREAGSHADRWTALALALHTAGPAPMDMDMSWIRPREMSRREQLRRW